MARPPALDKLIADRAGRDQGPVRYRPQSWETALADVASPGLLDVLHHDGYTRPASPDAGRPGDRLITRDALMRVCAAADLEGREAVLSAFLLTMVWGSGTSNSRSLRNTARALADPGRTAEQLAEAAAVWRSLVALDAKAVAGIYNGLDVPGIGPAFFTKWFAASGRRTGRYWQPLILDSRVAVALNRRLGVFLYKEAQSKAPAARYVAYLRLLHRWAGRDADAARLEWVLFDAGAPQT